MTISIISKGIRITYIGFVLKLDINHLVMLWNKCVLKLKIERNKKFLLNCRKIISFSGSFFLKLYINV